MKKNELVAIAMSGGVDSSVAALLLKQQGYRVVGLTMQLVDCGQEKISGCCGIEAIRSAQRVCTELNIPHYIINFRQQFKKQIISNFIQEYKNGRTPNPCIICNEKIKFDLLLKRAREIGADYLATGHYARIRVQKSRVGGKNYELLKGKDKDKDQSYFLYRLSQDQLKYLLFPLGQLTKVRVRQIAKKNKLVAARRPESQEICFIPDNNYRHFLLQNNIKQTPGWIVDKNQNVLGQHLGLSNYTIGQRKGLGLIKIKNQKLRIKDEDTAPFYVIKINPQNNTLVVGLEKDLYQKRCLVKNIHWISGMRSKLPLTVKAKIRYRSPLVVARIGQNKNYFIVDFRQSQRAITPGQSIVFYSPCGHKTIRGQGQQLLGGGIIEEVLD